MEWSNGRGRSLHSNPRLNSIKINNFPVLGWTRSTHSWSSVLRADIQCQVGSESWLCCDPPSCADPRGYRSTGGAGAWLLPSVPAAAEAVPEPSPCPGAFPVSRCVAAPNSTSPLDGAMAEPQQTRESVGSGFARKTATEHKRVYFPKTSLVKESFPAEVGEEELCFTAWKYSFLPVSWNEASSWQLLLREEQPSALLVLLSQGCDTLAPCP